MSTLDDLFRALADPTRREMMNHLRGGGLAVGELAAEFPVSRPAISKHLAVLEDAGLVAVRKEGRRRVVELAAGSLAAVDGWLEDYRRVSTPPKLVSSKTPKPSGPGVSSPSRRALEEDDWRVW